MIIIDLVVSALDSCLKFLFVWRASKRSEVDQRIRIHRSVLRLLRSPLGKRLVCSLHLVCVCMWRRLGGVYKPSVPVRLLIDLLVGNLHPASS